MCSWQVKRSNEVRCSRNDSCWFAEKPFTESLVLLNAWGSGWRWFSLCLSSLRGGEVDRRQHLANTWGRELTPIFWSWTQSDPAVSGCLSKEVMGVHPRDSANLCEALGPPCLLMDHWSQHSLASGDTASSDIPREHLLTHLWARLGYLSCAAQNTIAEVRELSPMSHLTVMKASRPEKVG